MSRYVPVQRARKISVEQRDRMIERYLAGERPVDLGKEYGVTDTYVTQCVKAAGYGLRYGKGGYIPPPNGRKSSVEHHGDTIRSMIASGHTDVQIGTALGVGRKVIGTYRAKHQIAQPAQRITQRVAVSTSRFAGFDWTDAAIKRLRELWADGVAIAEIGRLLGVSKSAAVGKAHRLCLEARLTPIIQSGVRKRPVRRVKVPTTTLPALSITTPMQPGPDLPVRVMAISPQPAPLRFGRVRDCCFPIGEPRTRGFRMCDAPTEPGGVYCAEHAARAYVRSPTHSASPAP